MAQGDVLVNLVNPAGNGCAIFDGIDDYILLGDGSILNIHKNFPLSVSFWFLVRATTRQGFFTLAASATDRFGFTVDSSKLRAGFYNGVWVHYKSYQTNISLNTWYHAVYTFDGTTPNMYVNNILSTGSLTPYAGSSNRTVIGNDDSLGTNQLNGGIADVQVYLRALSAAEVEYLYISGCGGGCCTDIKHRWFLEKNALASIGTINGTGSGVQYGVIETDLRQQVSTRRVTANDRNLISSSNGQIMFVHIEEA